MAAQWMGFTISIDCGPMGVFQGVVTAVEAEPQSVTLSRVFHNGVPHTSPSIVIRYIVSLLYLQILFAWPNLWITLCKHCNENFPLLLLC